MATATIPLLVKDTYIRERSLLQYLLFNDTFTNMSKSLNNKTTIYGVGETKCRTDNSNMDHLLV